MGEVPVSWLHTVFVLAVAYLAVFLEAWCRLPHWLGVHPDVLPALMVYTALTNGLASVVLLAVCGGLLFDSLSLNPLGISVTPLLVIGWMIYQSRDLLLRENRFAQFVLGVVAGAFQPVAVLFLLFNLGLMPLVGWFSLWQWMALALTAGAITPLCFKLFDRLRRAFEYQPANSGGFRPDREIKRGRF